MEFEGLEVMLLEIGLGGWFLWGGKLPARPSPRRQFPNLGTPDCFLQGCGCIVTSGNVSAVLLARTRIR